ncbi:alginate export family protein [Flavobacterium agrisoli]|uniref:Alginate export family protein n=1 Tax=Flavobacterium agrisoli TaxID=2793066 RepID=A0A934UI07_9FLAO|nr:alginate export family protein [Flavobacterium agrisoli]MBK0368327.1 alginate export family protein [Flavobacterium agrisoli]
MKSDFLRSLLVLLILGYPKSYSQTTDTLKFGVLRQNDDISMLKTKENKTVYEDSKWIPIAKNYAMSFGGGYRFQTEGFLNQDFSRTEKEDNIWFLNRLMFYSKFELGTKLDFFLELNSSLVNNKRDVSPVDRDEVATNQVFIKYNFFPNYELHLGRENIKLGSGRLVDYREGPNVRRSFDLIKFNYSKNNLQLALFFSIPVQPNYYAFDNDFLDFQETFSGFYLTKALSETSNIDLYGFYQKDDNTTYATGTANERRYSIGTRLFGSLHSIKFDNEAVYQWGNFGNQKISAYTLSINCSHNINLVSNTDIIGLKTELISGDKNATDNKLNTFDALYPRGAYFGRVAKFGPSNLIDLHPYINLKLKKNYYVELDYELFWRYSVYDAIYGASLHPDYLATNTKSFTAQQFGTVIGCDYTNHLNLEFETNTIFPADYFKTNHKSSTLFHAVISLEYKF